MLGDDGLKLLLILDMGTRNSKIRAFTLIEAMVTIALIAILIALAAPAFTALIQNNYSVSIASNLAHSLQFARSEAIRSNTPVSVCATADTNFTSCGSAWGTGWIVFTDANGSGTISSGTDTILRIERLTGNNANITTSPSTNSATYNNVGFPATSSANVTFQIFATGCTGNYARNVNISLTGRITSTATNCP